MCKSLLKKIRDDLDLARGLELLSSDAGPQSTYQLDPTHARDTNIKSAHRSVRTRLYFTSESHLHTLLNVLRYTSHDDVLPSPIPTSAQDWLTDIKELAYMTSIVIRVFERDQYPLNDPRHYRVELMVRYVYRDFDCVICIVSYSSIYYNMHRYSQIRITIYSTIFTNMHHNIVPGHRVIH